MVQAVPNFCPECSSRSLRLTDDGTVRCDSCRLVLIEAQEVPSGLLLARNALERAITRKTTPKSGETK